MKKVLLALTAIAALTVTSPLQVDTPEDQVKYRKSVMKAIGGHTGSIKAVVTGAVSHGLHVAHHARALNEMGGLVADLFPESSGPMDYSDTAALPAIWDEPDKFKQAVEAFQTAAANLVTAAEGGDSAAIGAAFGELGKSCGGCHKPFRVKK